MRYAAIGIREKLSAGGMGVAPLVMREEDTGKVYTLLPDGLAEMDEHQQRHLEKQGRYIRFDRAVTSWNEIPIVGRPSNIAGLWLGRDFLRTCFGIGVPLIPPFVPIGTIDLEGGAVWVVNNTMAWDYMRQWVCSTTESAILRWTGGKHPYWDEVAYRRAWQTQWVLPKSIESCAAVWYTAPKRELKDAVLARFMQGSPGISRKYIERLRDHIVDVLSRRQEAAREGIHG